ncbi:MAG: aldo/keto reductase [Pseudomonadota bacterium]
MRLALGTVQFGVDYGIANRGGKVAPKEIFRILERAAAAGVDTLDTAVAYGESETVLGKVGVAGWRLVTKLPELPEDCANVETWVFDQMSASRARLDVETVDAVMLHRPAQLHGPRGDELLQALYALRRTGLAAKVGVSIYAPDELGPLFELADFDIVQAPLNILDRRLVDSGWAARLDESGVELHARSVFLQGLLLMAPDARPASFAPWTSIWTHWNQWLEANSLTPLEACLRYVLSCKAVDRAVVGLDNLAQLDEILHGAVGDMPDPPTWPEPVAPALIDPSAWASL